VGSNALNANGDIYTICVDPAGNIYAAGVFWDTTGSYYVAKWNGTSWSELGSGLTPGYVNNEIEVLCSDSAGNIYAGGQFKNASGKCYVAKWNGSSWGEVGSASSALNANANILSISIDKHGYLYAAGDFTNATGHYYVAKWDGISWSEVGTGSGALDGNGTINTIFIDSNDNIYAAGNFTDSGVVDTGGNLYVAMWNGSSWNELGSGVCRQLGGDIQIFSVVKDNYGIIYAAGNLRNDSNNFYIAKFDGSTWSELGIGSAAVSLNNIVSALYVDASGNLYAGGWYRDTAIRSVYDQTFIAKWDGASWSKLGGDFYGSYSGTSIIAICSDAIGNIYTAGTFFDTTVSLIFIDTMISPIDTIIYHPRYVAKYAAATTVVTPLQMTSGLVVYPNPASSNINVRLNSASSNLLGSGYYLYDCTGRILRSGTLENQVNSIDVAELSSGVYILKLTGQNSANYRIVKE